jgi:hypothetical protein
MEVHAHSHTPRKKWTHYFWEFLMLFLAVFCGFLAEYRLEHMIEHQRAKVYAANLHEELKNDTTRLNYVIQNNNNIAGQLDTFCMLVKENIRQNITTGMLYFYANSVTKVEYFSSSNATVEQLKGSGNLRIMDTKLAYKISEYDKMIRELEKEYELSKVEFAKMEDLHFKAIDVYYSEKMFANREDAPRDSVFKINDLPVSKDPELMKAYTGLLKFESGIYIYQNRRYLSPLKDSATQLLTLLQKKYHIK